MEKLPAVFIKTIKHFFPDLNQWMRKIKDPRDPELITYSLNAIIWTGLFIHIFKLCSRRQINFICQGSVFKDNFEILTEEEIERIPNDGTVNYSMKRVNPEEFELVICKMANSLIRRKVFDESRFSGYFLIGIDATGLYYFKERHCPRCMEIELSNGEKRYCHHVLEAKLITKEGLAISLGSEFIENSDEIYNKQDCEINAFKRLEKKLKKQWPQLKICLTGDALYACEPVFEICIRNKWKFICVFKEGRSSDAYNEYLALKNAAPENHLMEKDSYDIVKNFHWINRLDYHGIELDVMECEEQKPADQPKKFVFITNFCVDQYNCVSFIKGGRLRWKIENEGFNTQKNQGYNLEHLYSKNEKAVKNFYLLLQIAHIINQLIEHGNLTGSIKKVFGSIKNFTFMLREALRTIRLDKNIVLLMLSSNFQIRLNSS